MLDYEDISIVNKLLVEAQTAEKDNREKVREVTHFLQKTDGQWDPDIARKMGGRPRYTFDKCNPVVDSIAGEMEQADFAIKIRPAGGESTKDSAQLYDGLIRNIESMSNASHVYNSSGRKMVAGGFDAWRVTQEWGNTDSFEQDLFIRKIANAVDRVWFDVGAEMQDMSDANHAWVLQSLTKEEYKDRFPNGSMRSVGEDKKNNVYYYKADLVVVGEILYKKPTKKTLVLMSNNAVYEVNDDFERVVEELSEQGITEQRRRTRDSHIVMSRLFDGQEWLSEEKETVFDYIPVIPIYGNFDISENKVTYRGVVNHLMDAQRAINFLQSRELEEIALAPVGKYWMTKEQMEGNIADLQTMNTNNKPVQGYKHLDGVPPPFWQGGAQVNQGLQAASVNMGANITQASGQFAASQGNAPNQSGYAIELQQNKGDTSVIKYFGSREIATTHTGRILANAIPRVYDTARTVRILGEDGISKMEKINDQVLDNETGEMVALNDLRKGKYDVTMDIGPAFKNRQQETARAFLELAGIDPSIIQQGKDIWLNNISVPGMKQMAERARKQMLESGIIPDNQMTEEEKEKAQAIINQANASPPQPSAMDQAITEQTQANTADIQSKMQERQDKAEIEAEKLRQNEIQMVINAQAAADKQATADRQQFADTQMKMIEALNTQADTLNKIREAMGVDTIVGPTNTEAYKEQAEIVLEAQEKVENR